MKGVKLDHVACAVRKIENCFNLVKKLSGIPVKGGQNSEFRGGQWLTMNSAKLELIEPVGAYDENNFLHKYLNKRGPGIHHVTFTVPSLAEAIKRAQKLNFQVLDVDESKPHWKEAFLHPKQTMNMLIQLAEHNPSLAKPGESWDGSWSGFQGYPPKDASEDFRIKGLSGVNLLTKQDNLGHAERIFCDLLGGEMHQPSTFPQLVPSRFYVFTWKDSPLNIAINIELYNESKQREGPLGIEMLVSRDYSDRSIMDPDLGATLIPLVKNSTQ